MLGTNVSAKDNSHFIQSKCSVALLSPLTTALLLQMPTWLATAPLLSLFKMLLSNQPTLTIPWKISPRSLLPVLLIPLLWFNFLFPLALAILWQLCNFLFMHIFFLSPDSLSYNANSKRAWVSVYSIYWYMSCLELYLAHSGDSIAISQIDKQAFFNTCYNSYIVQKNIQSRGNKYKTNQL